MNQTEQQQHGLPVWLAVLRRRKIVIFLCTLPVPAAALALSLAPKKEYSASASLLFRDPQFDQQLVQQQIRNLPLSQRNGAQGSQLKQRAEQLQIMAALQTGNAELVQPATVPGSPSSPKPVRNSVIGGILGFLLGLGLALLLERMDRRLKEPKEIGDLFGRPILGAIPESKRLAKGEHPLTYLFTGEGEPIRMLRANLRYFNVDREIRSVLITSAAPGDGKSTIAAEL